MHPMRMLVVRAYRDVPWAKQKVILVSNFTSFLIDKKLAIYLNTVDLTSILKAELIATSVDKLISKQKKK